jgi:hypothetical protein
MHLLAAKGAAARKRIARMARSVTGIAYQLVTEYTKTERNGGWGSRASFGLYIILKKNEKSSCQTTSTSAFIEEITPPDGSRDGGTTALKN